MYADDTTLFTTLKSTRMDDPHNLLINDELSKISNWLLANKLSLNVKKSKFIVFRMPQKKIEILVLKIAGAEIECVDHFNLLGITIDSYLSWTPHINKLVCKLSQTTGILKKLNYFLPQIILKNIYTSIFLCHINYGILAWGYNFNSNRIYKLQKRAVRIITCSKYNAHSEPIFKMLNLLRIADIFLLQQLKFYFKLVNMELPTYFNNMACQHNYEVHQHNTRAARSLFIPQVNHEFAKKCIRYSIIQTVNRTPAPIISKIATHSISGFCKYIKNDIKKYSMTCLINNCYVCQH